jgi:hypothetical protein
VIVAANGQAIGSLGYYGSYEGGKKRYYVGYKGGSGEGAAQLQAEAQAAAGSPEIFIKVKDGHIGPIIPTQRTGNL